MQAEESSIIMFMCPIMCKNRVRLNEKTFFLLLFNISAVYQQIRKSYISNALLTQSVYVGLGNILTLYLYYDETRYHLGF